MSINNNDCEIIEVDVAENEEQLTEPKPKARRGRPSSKSAAEVKEIALKNLEKGRAKAALMVQRRKEQKAAMMVAREKSLHEKGKDGWWKYSQPEYDEDISDDDYESDSDPDNYKNNQGPYIAKTYKQVSGGRKPLKTIKTVSGRNLNEDSDDDDRYSPKYSRVKEPKRPSLKDQRIDFLERKINEIIDHVKAKRKPTKKVSKTTVIMPPQMQMVNPVQPKQIPDDAKKALKNVLSMF